jgi:pyruvate decarboxylase
MLGSVRFRWFALGGQLQRVKCRSEVAISPVRTSNEDLHPFAPSHPDSINTGYATDGYARVNGIGAMITTYGVGELSAMNAHAGAFAEHVPIVHIVGGPPTSVRQQKRFAIHHTLANGDYDVFRRMFGQVSVTDACLCDPSVAVKQIDTALRNCWIHSRPVYLELPSDMVTCKVEGTRLATPLDLSYPQERGKLERVAMGELMQRIYDAKRPCILIDMIALRQRVRPDSDFPLSGFVAVANSMLLLPRPDSQPA